MIKPSLSLKTSVALAFLSLGIVIVVGYTLLSVDFFFRGMDSIVSANMEKALKTYVKTVDIKDRQHRNEFSGYDISLYWNQQPAEIQQAFQLAPKQLDTLMVKKDAEWFQRPKVIYFLIALEQDGQRYYISHKGTAEEASPLIGKNAHKSKQLLYSVSLAITLLLILIIWWLLRKVSHPITELTQWTHALTPNSLTTPPPDFVYPELNEMAALIRNALSSVNDSLEREHNFLRFTSHELRTPISVIRNNVQLARKLEQQAMTPDGANKQQDIIDRIDRASLTMQHLSETLLWLSRENVESLPSKSIRLDKMINSIVDELTYLLNKKQVNIELKLSPIELTIPVIAARIVIGNLIRNAFQHTWQGSVSIEQHQQTLTIHNHCEQFQADKKSAQQGFGLGLRLTEELCQKLDWPYHNTQQSDGHEVSLILNTQR